MEPGLRKRVDIYHAKFGSGGEKTNPITRKNIGKSICKVIGKTVTLC